MAKKIVRYHLVPHSQGWAIKKSGNSRALKVVGTKSEAEKYFKNNVGLSTTVDLTIHGTDGTIQKNIRFSPEEEDGGCFITTACIEYYNLDDNCYQLKVLRIFRDNYLSKTKQGKENIELYYKVAPKILEQLEKEKNKKSTFEKIFKKINKAVKTIEERKYELAFYQYRCIVLSLLKKYHL